MKEDTVKVEIGDWVQASFDEGPMWFQVEAMDSENNYGGNLANLPVGERNNEGVKNPIMQRPLPYRLVGNWVEVHQDKITQFCSHEDMLRRVVKPLETLGGWSQDL
jgi:hypothetical protein